MFCHLKCQRFFKLSSIDLFHTNRLILGTNHYLSTETDDKVVKTDQNFIDKTKSKVSQKIMEIEDKLRADPNSPFGRMERTPKSDPNIENQTQNQNKATVNPFAPFEGNTNPVTGEKGGPTGPEPTRYGDWERKGRVSDF